MAITALPNYEAEMAVHSQNVFSQLLSNMMLQRMAQSYKQRELEQQRELAEQQIQSELVKSGIPITGMAPKKTGEPQQNQSLLGKLFSPLTNALMKGQAPGSTQPTNSATDEFVNQQYGMPSQPPAQTSAEPPSQGQVFQVGNIQFDASGRRRPIDAQAVYVTDEQGNRQVLGYGVRGPGNTFQLVRPDDDTKNITMDKLLTKTVIDEAMADPLFQKNPRQAMQNALAKGFNIRSTGAPIYSLNPDGSFNVNFPQRTGTGVPKVTRTTPGAPNQPSVTNVRPPSTVSQPSGEFAKGIAGGFNSLAGLDQLEKLDPIIEKNSTFGMGPVAGEGTRIAGKYGINKEAGTYISVRDKMKADTQALIEGIPSNFDTKIFEATIPDIGQPQQMRKDKVNILRSTTKELLKTSISYWRAKAGTVPAHIMKQAQKYGIKPEDIAPWDDMNNPIAQGKFEHLGITYDPTKLMNSSAPGVAPQGGVSINQFLR